MYQRKVEYTGLKKSNLQSTVLSIFAFKVTIPYVAISKLNRQTHVSQPELADDGFTILLNFRFVATLVGSFQSLTKLETGWFKVSDFNDRNS